MEGPAQRPWRPRSPWCTLLGHLRPSSDMANGATLLDPVTHTWMEEPPTRLCYGLSSGPCRNAAIHAVAPRIQARRDHTQNTFPQIGAQRLWAKAGRSCMEQIYGPGHEGDRFQAQCL